MAALSITDMRAPYLTDGQIEYQAQFLLNSYESSYDKVYEPPVPIEDIITKYLGLSIEVDDFTRSKYFGDVGEQVLGFIDLKEKAIFVNELIDPLVNPDARAGRFNFTLGHEAGHAVLHGDLFEEYYAQTGLFEDESAEKPAILCRHPDDETAPRRPFIEQHADKFSGAILMPKKLVAQEWQKQFNTDASLSYEEIATIGDLTLGEMDIQAGVKEAIRPLAEKFEVSFTAMRIRLEGMGLLTDGTQAVLL